MNSRERMLMIVLIAVVGGGGFVIGTVVWFVKPLLAYNKTIDALKDDNDLEQLKWDTFQFERKKLELARLKSLPLNPGDASSEYSAYLERMMAQTKLRVVSIVPSQAAKVKPSAATPQGIKDVGHLVMTFTISARGELAELVKLMELLQDTPYEHRIRSLNIDRVDTGFAKSSNSNNTLVINMVIETMLVARNVNMPGHPPGVDQKCMIYDHIANRSGFAPTGWGLIGTMVVMKKAAPTPEDRQYDDIARKNIFVGWTPTTKVGPSEPPPPPPPPAAKRPGEIPRYIRLVQTTPSQQEAYLLNLFYRNEEFKVSSDPKTGYQIRRISDDTGDYIFFFMKVLRVDPGMVHFQIENHVFTIKLGQTLEDAIQEPLSLDRMDDLDLDWDRAWAKEQMQDKEEEAPAKKSGKSGKNGKSKSK
ncbi:MAG TPA: hypothetical protein VFE62_22325 [Gemmataceae bacterium]|nr:hypothetical protein [Gemmataceae bacterium]